MKYLKTFLEKQGNYSNTLSDPKVWNTTNGTSGNTHKKEKLPGELVDDEDEDITIPINVDITGHIGTPTKSTRMRKLPKEPSVRNT